MELVLVERPTDGVVHVVLNRPERRNALTGPLVEQLGDAIEELHRDASVNAIVLRGAGGAFCSGLDLKEFNADPVPDWVPDFGARWRRVHRLLFESDRIIVGALERAAVNGGAALALACDLLVAGEQSFLQVGEIQQGMPAPMNMAWLRLRHTEAVTARLVLLGDRVMGDELVDLGIAHRSVSDAAVVSVADELAARLADHDPSGVRRIKTSMRRTVVSESAAEWFARPEAADPLAGVALRPRAADDR